MMYVCGMEKTKSELVDVSRLHTLKGYAKRFGIPYNSVYSRHMRSLLNRGKEQYDCVTIDGVSFIRVSEEQEKELLKKSKGGK